VPHCRVMGTVHDILTARGKQGALALDLGREVIEAAAAYMGDEDGGIGFLYSGWCQAALPHKRLPDHIGWQIEGERLVLVVEPGMRPGPNGGDPISVGVPFGSRARLILLYLQSEALRTGSREVLLGRSLREWLGKMGINAGGKDIRDVREQAERISLCRLTFHVRSGDRIGLLNQNIVETAMFVSAGDRAQGSLFCEVARLSEGFFQQLQRHPVPLEDAALRAIANNSQAIDIYCWLAYRLHALPSPRSVSWAALRGQFGRSVSRLDNFRRRFKPNLDLAVAVYPAARVDVGDAGLVLHPSRAPVAPKMIGIGR
jgi:hypothetical protein